jgi:hypothetical protein
MAVATAGGIEGGELEIDKQARCNKMNLLMCTILTFNFFEV